MGSITDSAAFSVGCRKAISKWPENAQQNVYRFPTSILRIFRFAHSAGPLHFQPIFKPLSPCLSCGAGGGRAGSLYAGDQHFHSSGPQGTRIVSGTLGVRNQRVPTGVRKTISIRITYFPAFVQLFLSCKLPVSCGPEGGQAGGRAEAGSHQTPCIIAYYPSRKARIL